MKALAVWLALVWPVAALAGEHAISTHLQEVSVTIKAGMSQGSGVIVTRELAVAPSSTETVRVNFVWTAAHVVDHLRSTREVVDPVTGTKRTVIQFRDASIVQELVEGGRRVGEIELEARVIKYSDAEEGEDLALLMLRKRDFISQTADFADDGIIPPGTRLYHVGSLLGQVGANSLTSGIVSQVGRVLELGNGGGVVFDQTTVTAFPGSSGGGVFLTEDSGEEAGRCVGLLVRGAGETFNLIAPVRRMWRWAEEVGCEWALTTEVPPPDLETLLKQPVEDPSTDFGK